MLHHLLHYARDNGLETEPGFKAKEARWALCFDAEGNFTNTLVELGNVGSRRNTGHRFPKCPDLSQPELIGGPKRRSHFLIDTAEVVALFGADSEDQKGREKHEFFVSLLREASGVMPQLGGVAAAMADNQTLNAIRDCMIRQGNPKVKPTDKVTLRIDRDFPVESSAWHEWWREFRGALKVEKAPGRTVGKKGGRRGAALMRGFATGELVEPAATHPKIEGLADVGGQSSGSPLVGFDKEAFASYGLDQSLNAAVSEEAASAYRAALNDLIGRRSVRLVGAKVVYWFKDTVKQEDDPLPWLREGAEVRQLDAQHRARSLLEAIRTGTRPDLANNTYYSLALSGSGGRVMIRDWMEGQFPHLVENVVAWFDDLAIVRRDGSSPAPLPKFFAVLGATVRALDELPAPIATTMWRAAVQAGPIPHTVLAQALARARIDFIQDNPPNHARMGLIRAYHVRKMRRTRGGQSMSQELKPNLNESHPHPAYHCGRLMAMLAALQRSALGDVGAGVVQRYYAAASSTPALVLGRVTRTSQFHLNKLNPGLAHWYEGQISGVWGRIKDTPPRALDLEEQSLFALGYYQQLASLRAARAGSQDDPKSKEDNGE